MRLPKFVFNFLSAETRTAVTAPKSAARCAAPLTAGRARTTATPGGQMCGWHCQSGSLCGVAPFRG